MKNKKGSALVAVMFVAICFGLLIAAVLQYSLAEKKLNHRQYMMMKAQYAAEAAANAGVHEIQKNCGADSNVPTTNFVKGGSHGLFLPNSYYDFFGPDSKMAEAVKVNLPYEKPYNPSIDYGKYSTEVLASTVTKITSDYINPVTQPDDPLKGFTVQSYLTTVLARATVTDNVNKPYVANVKTDLYVRDAPLFAYAIFYNMDLEIHPGADMTIIGKVHSNNDLYYSSAANLKFLDTVNAVGNIYRNHMAVYKADGTPDFTSYAYTRSDGTTVQTFRNGTDASGNPVTTSNQLGGKWVDSLYNPDPQSAFINTYKGWSQYSYFDMPVSTIINVPEYKPARANSGTQLNGSYQMIMPLSPGGNPQTEQQKYAYKAGLTIEISPDGKSYSCYTYARDPDPVHGPGMGPVQYDASGNPVKIPVGIPQTWDSSTSAPKPAIIIDPYYYDTKSGTTYQKTTSGMADMRRGGNNYTTGPDSGGQISLVVIDVGKLKQAVEAPDNLSNGTNFPHAPAAAGSWNPVPGTGTYTKATKKNGTTATVYNANVNSTTITTSADPTTGTVTTTWPAPNTSSDPAGNYAPANWWNGVVYVKTPTTADPGRADGVVPGVPGLGVKLINGQRIPDPQYTQISGGNNTRGMTLCTNTPLYVQGNYNADGADTNNTNGQSIGSTTPDQLKKQNESGVDTGTAKYEPPASLIADAVTLLSNSWSSAYQQNSQLACSNRPAASLTEYSAAIISGIAPTSKISGATGQLGYSGGVENYPRFLEDWGGKSCVYRGSLVCLYASEIAKQKWWDPSTASYYGAPTRKWGFNTLFSGAYGGPAVYPAGMPLLRSTKKSDTKWLNEKEWKDEITTLFGATAAAKY